jgi:hypothetical protein
MAAHLKPEVFVCEVDRATPGRNKIKLILVQANKKLAQLGFSECVSGKILQVANC